MPHTVRFTGFGKRTVVRMWETDLVGLPGVKGNYRSDLVGLCLGDTGARLINLDGRDRGWEAVRA